MSTESLQTLFSETAKSKFARLHKPAEFVEKIKPNLERYTSPTRKKPRYEVAKVPVAHLEGDKDELNAAPIDKDERTCFVGNVSKSENKKSLLRFFKDFGDIESIRLRSVPVEGTAVDEDGNLNLVKKVCSNKRKFGEQKGSFNAYVVFKTRESVERAVTANNRFMGGRHIRVDYCKPSVLNPGRTVFVGSLPYYVDEEELRNHFSTVLAGGNNSIDSIRIVRDPQTLIGKGIAYVSFNSNADVVRALSLDKSLFRKRKIRVSTCGKKTKRNVVVSMKVDELKASNDSDANFHDKKRSRISPDFIKESISSRQLWIKKPFVKRKNTFSTKKERRQTGRRH